jgi:uncharacterized membrane protein (DUF373 family)
MAKSVRSFAHKAERLIIHALIFMMAVVLVLATIELGYSIIKAVIKPPYFLLEFEEVLDLFGVFLLVLIGIELLDTIKVYFKRNVVHVEVVVLVAIIAIARKVIVLEPKDYEPGTLIGIGLIILALSISYFLIKKLGCEMVSIKKLPKSSQEVIKDELRDTSKLLAGDDVKIDLKGTAEDKEDETADKSENEDSKDAPDNDRGELK